MAIIPDEIREIQGMDLPKQINVLYNYIKYLKEQIDFWASNRSKDIGDINEEIAGIGEEITSAISKSTFKYKGFLPTTTDLNVLTGVDNVGVYAIQSSAVNCPAAWAILYNCVPTYGTQMLVSATTIWTRSYTGSPLAWTSWRSVSLT